jgi:hypothetical protein
MSEFDWDRANVSHFSQRPIEPHETEEVVDASDRFTLGESDRGGERRYVVIGSTDGGRVLVVVYTLRDDRFRVITARRPTPREARTFRRKRRR